MYIIDFALWSEDQERHYILANVTALPLFIPHKGATCTHLLSPSYGMPGHNSGVPVVIDLMAIFL